MKQDMVDLCLAYVRAAPPDDVRAVMRLSLLDWAACGIAGQAEGGFSDWAGAVRAGGSCTSFDGVVRDVTDAALVNGTLSHALDYDDTHFAHIGHPSVVMASAALAVGQAVTASLADIVDAALVGAEVSAAVGLWLGRGHYQIGYHQTATAGAFGATAAAARLLGLTDAQTRHAFGLCATMASGLKAQFGTMGKPLNAGLAARAGIEAALWAQSGMTGAAEGLEAFGATHHGAGDAVAFAWRMGEVSHKYHACCHGLHAALEAMGDLPALAAANEVVIETHPRWLSVCNQTAPDTGLGAKFSYAHVAAMTAHGLSTADINAFTDACATDPDLVGWRSRVRVVGDDALTEMQARVRADGAEAFHDLAAAQPLEARAARVRHKARALVGARADDLERAIAADDRDGFAAMLLPQAQTSRAAR
jgi:2-methylcitrate dehydratase PrpD